MANVTRATLATERDSLFPTNNANLITASDLRQWLTDGIASFVTQKDVSTLENAIYEADSTPIVAGATTALSGADGNFIHIQGTTEITSFGILPAGARFILTFDNAAQIKASSAIIIPGVTSGNLKTAVAGDCCMIVSEGSGNWRIVGYFPKGGAGSGTVTDVTASAPLSSTSGTTPDISITKADASTDGYLSSTDWGTFNSKGDVTASGTPSNGDFVRFTSATDITTATASAGKVLIGSPSTGTTIGEITLGANLDLIGTVLSASGGTGTVTSSGSPTSGDLAKFTSATDITKAVSGTDYAPATSGSSILKGNGAGGFSSATSGTDYAPATSGSALLKGNGSGGFSSASAGTDYIAPPSGTAILKANSGGALANALAGTDYIAPPSGTAILKANSGGALANATAGTDYVAPGAATGSGLTMATSRLLGRTSAASPGAIEEISLTTTGTSGAATLSGGTLNIPQYSGGSGSGTVNPGTLNRLTYYAATGNAVSELPTAGSSGQILQSNGTGSAPTWVNAPAATLTLGTSIVGGGATAGRLLLTTTSGANQVLNQDSNLNYDTTNDLLGIGVGTPTGRLHLAAPVAATPSMLLVPSSGVTPSGTTNGSIWCNTASSNTSLTMYKDSALTKIVTIDRNPELAIGSANGIVIADANGSLTKSADLTALGIFAQTSTVTVSNTAASTTLIGTGTGSTTLSANFFGVGKTIKIFVSGSYGCIASSQQCDLKLTIGGVAVGTISLSHTNALAGRYYDTEFTLTCRTTGTTGTIQFMGIGKINTSTSNIESFFQISSTSGSINTTGTLAIDLQADWVTGDPLNTISASILHITYLN